MHNGGRSLEGHWRDDVPVTDTGAICELTHGLLCQLPKKGVLSVVEYLGKMKVLGNDEMAAGGRPLEDEELLVEYIITGLNENFAPYRQ